MLYTRHILTLCPRFLSLLMSKTSFAKPCRSAFSPPPPPTRASSSPSVYHLISSFKNLQ
ncbi:hypothetical protein AMTRI_Chr02g255690 [Amborella trichopoda]